MAGVAAFLSCIVTVLFMFALRPVAVAVGLVDVPGGRKRHGAPVPVIGGVAMTIGLCVGTLLIPHPASWTPVLFGVCVLALVGTIDDRFELPPNVRLIAHVCAALMVVFAANIVITHLGELAQRTLSLGVLSVPFTVLFIVTLVNAFNLIDGIDGLAGGLAFLGLAVMALVSLGTPLFPLLTVAASVVAGYLLFNLPLGFNAPVRAFMGDAGSTVLGLLVATAGIYLSQGELPRISPVVGLWFVAVPVFDLFAAIVRRVLSGRSPFAADYEHLHHKLADHGLSRRSTLLMILGLAAVFASVGVLGDMLAVADSTLLLLWFAAGVLYYQLLRFPAAAVRAVILLRGRSPSDYLAPVVAEQSSASER